jgi:AcrR family transcriptional regulator
MSMSASRATVTTQRLPRAERREQIARAAATVFMRGGFDGTSMDDVARQAGVTRLIVYRIFESKDELYRAVLDDVTADLYHSFEGADIGQGGVSQLLLAVARRHPDAFRLLWRQAANEPAFAELARVFRDLVTAYTETLLADATDDAPMRRWMAQALVSYHYEGVCTWLDDGDMARDDEFVAMASAGSRALVSAWVPRRSVR